MINTGRYIQLEASTEKVSYDSVRFIRIGHEVVMRFVRNDGKLPIRQFFCQGFGGDAMGGAGGGAVILVADDDQGRMF